MNQVFIPLDKSWIIRMGLLDMVNGYDDIELFLIKQENLSDDLVALERSAEVWKSGEPVDVGESGTLYRFLKFASWKLNMDKKFITKGTLVYRSINDDPKITELSQTELLKLDKSTSQWASAAVLLGDTERLQNPPFKLQLTYDAVTHWNAQRGRGEAWEPRYDETILRQAEAYHELLKGERPDFVPQQAEDFCFAYAFGYMTAAEGEARWPALRGHESDRIVETQEMLAAAKEGKEIISKDHRVVQAVLMWGKLNNTEVTMVYPQAVNKSWPQFWDFLSSKR
jgi:hypothetical protein